ncbi:hypothetical protein [Rhodococcus sp. Eu-32]|uniref:hypothetical protein n=1 Tax=Rhodococcus sp. Eu-32 TaxID=1017319 RepID=UPI0014030A64|nr:hypothetical protein [Rhodococcus sp. Eu-32]
MRIRTLIGPPLQQEIVRFTAVALALSHADPEGGTGRVPARNTSSRGRAETADH